MKTVTLNITEEAETAFFNAANALHELAGDDAPSPSRLMEMAINPTAAAGLYQAFIDDATGGNEE